MGWSTILLQSSVRNAWEDTLTQAISPCIHTFNWWKDAPTFSIMFSSFNKSSTTLGICGSLLLALIPIMFKLRFHGAMWLGSKDQKLGEQEKEKLVRFLGGMAKPTPPPLYT